MEIFRLELFGGDRVAGGLGAKKCIAMACMETTGEMNFIKFGGVLHEGLWNFKIVGVECGEIHA